ncbi:MAG: type II secretion system protein GspH [Gammaproteobacteria bacterium RIFCSPLOWO2_02_FULL_42_14]|nr:MAG: type II secretion system protein GspH [Gammaproteobacteria bacterium RIFCSPHIGHO2_02_FULL_42_43]OGT28982.1 MAG: type II secretion system protein GspH [Gammaproteobacteria bacterium RIFCSPHIGHO2_01_FULL_42_8]OGT51726.1 MAG: type II secretion system protein GspH [Gammaproteobacteria bacterium RIFCSPHIGHO2_12_FULL_41_25]OGT61623.1 MAG: type II secretion system protein GspH [Gammaproteobacteria bacterium RIFCSPLOWO2_02_FULL_42_14]OGT86247.1 MAG: type II secretion system protein GspH [Gammap
MLSSRSRVRSSGFTLIEILVVLVIIAIITAVTVLAFGQFGRGRREKMIINTFSRAIQAAHQQSILTSTALGLGINANGYQFYQYQLPWNQTQGTWHRLAARSLSNPTAFHNVFHVHVLSIAHFDEKNKTAAVPTILFLPNGSVTAFSVKLSGDKQQFVLSVQGNGAVASE